MVAAALAVRIAFALALPTFQAPDEEAHFRYVTFLGEERAMPIHPVERSFELFADPMAEAYQPPLAYATFVPSSWKRMLPPAAPARATKPRNFIRGFFTSILLGPLVRNGLPSHSVANTVSNVKRPDSTGTVIRTKIV